VFGYISDAHDNHPSGSAYGPGEAGYVAQLKEYEQGFAAFFAELKAQGIDETNTLFVVTADEGDHFAGKTKTGCDGVTTPCVYGTGEVGEVQVLVNQLLTAAGVTTPFGIHFDMAPAYYLNGNPSETALATRVFEKVLAELTILDPYLGEEVPLSVGLADRADGERYDRVDQPGVRLDAWRHSARNFPDLARARRSGSQAAWHRRRHLDRSYRCAADDVAPPWAAG